MTTLRSMSQTGGDISGLPDLSPKPRSSLEWWFVQGDIEGATLGRYEFMLSVFRQAGKNREPDGHMLLLTTRKHGADRHTVRSEVTRQLVENFNRDAPAEVRDAEIDRNLVGAVLSEIAAGGPPRPVRMRDDVAVIEATPLSIRWNDVSLRQTRDHLELSFALNADGPLIEVTAKPQRAWFEGRGLGGDGMGSMAYDSCPRLHLAGLAGEEIVSGEAWIDHQWGGYGWMHSPDDGAVLLGWDWLGINLEDGRDLIIMVHRDMRKLEPVSDYAVLFDGLSAPELVHGVTITGLQEWRSPQTMIDYPLRCRVKIPLLDATIDFEPTVDDQEIPVFGLIDAIWEGAGRVTGTMGGKPVSGRARLELHGYGYVADFAVYQKKWVDRIDRSIAGFLPRTLDQATLESYLGAPRWAYDATAQTEAFSQPVWDLLSRGGKHWRPIFGLLLLDALDVDVAPFETMFSVIPELVHNGSVIIDDIEDSSQTRRGEETIHRRYGLPTALNAGNMLYFLPLLSIADHPHLSAAQRDEVYQVVIKMFVQAHFGQSQDLYWSNLNAEGSGAVWADPDTRSFILQAHAFKSAAAVRAVADVACIVARSDRHVRSACARMAESWGVAFQMVDDVNNFSTSQRWGKLRGEDVLEGKVSYAIFRAVQLLEGAEKTRLLEILTSPDRDCRKEQLPEAIRLIETSGALEACRKEAREMAAQDWPAFSRSLPASRSKIMLRALLESLLGTPFEM